MKRPELKNKGFILPTVISYMLVLSIIMIFSIEIIESNIEVVGHGIKSQEAFYIAEAGINYYLWHLSHNPTDYKDGQSTPTTPNPTLGYGPYVHTYYDNNEINQGSYTLWINPQGNGSTIVNVESIGKANGSNATRTIVAQIGSPSYASYAVSSNSALWFGSTETADGPVLSNQGVRMDGPNTDTVSSANTTYVPSEELGGDGSSHSGVWCNLSVTSPVNCATRDTSDWVYPVASLNFNNITSSLCSLKKTAFLSNSSTSSLAGQTNACSLTPTTLTNAYLPQRSTSGSYSLTKGYLIQLDPNGTYDLYDVNGENDTLTPYTSALTLQLVASGVSLPSSDVIFAEDNVWVRTNPTFHGRVTIGAGRLANSNNNGDIVIADDLLYSTKNGSDAIGLVAQDSVLIAPYAPPASGSFNYEVDGDLIAETGEIWYPDTYRSSPSTCTIGWTNSNQTLSFYGSIAENQTWTWGWIDGTSPCGNAALDKNGDEFNGDYFSGFEFDTTEYDYNSLYTPPPSYPITSTYNILSWREILTVP